ncbi:ABC transporter ATP-binding protein [Variovorax arabinosiphilus]|uniref:ABC transporter ATP-binding protein n=1 Tax=Variovorax arabinosiphilus TaxID=3053498 RepID=UPI002576EE36|nr:MULTISPECIES: ABC transporter ATP-binding protein [unclassified Variovorax]MDM0118421.1 ABC transporter ATP-binding protein [Variovorax sp. J2L1-78]MDM0128846.1 ABC transporter ATP-binding protein [Variovorax sp. J2L1-63]MDM0233368.1 ABC transporter ATP-binding protein [Variovorax sp. J2R1-6]
MSGPVAVLRARSLVISVRSGGRRVPAVRGMDIEVTRGETLAIVGESGCGKSLTALALAGLLPDGVQVSGGSIELFGEDVTALDEAGWRLRRGCRIAMVFQDPMAALNPVLTIGEQIVEAIHAHRPASTQQAREEAVALLARVKLPHPERSFAAYPHQLSGGMRQRALIAIAIANRPEVLIADEPTTALDATVQAEILALLRSLQRESGMALVIITHDLNLVARWADRVTVMYAGRAVEDRPGDVLLDGSVHPYTRALMAARPRPRPAGALRPRLAEIPGRVPSPGDAGPGCAFAGRCGFATQRCETVAPDALPVTRGVVWCHAASEGRLDAVLEVLA